MYGVPTDLPLDLFLGHSFSQVCLGQFQIQLHSSAGSIDVEGAWELRSGDGRVLDQSHPHDQRDCYRIHQVIGVPVVAVHLEPPTAFVLRFHGGIELKVFDDDPRHESATLRFADHSSVYII